MTDQIPFAQFVLRDIAENGFRYGQFYFMGEPCYIDVHRTLTSRGKVSASASDGLHKDAWNLHVGWFHVSLIRQDKYPIKLTKEERKAFRAINRERKVDAWFAKREAEQQARQAKKDAQTWP